MVHTCTLIALILSIYPFWSCLLNFVYLSLHIWSCLLTYLQILCTCIINRLRVQISPYGFLQLLVTNSMDYCVIVSINILFLIIIMLGACGHVLVNEPLMTGYHGYHWYYTHDTVNVLLCTYNHKLSREIHLVNIPEFFYKHFANIKLKVYPKRLLQKISLQLIFRATKRVTHSNCTLSR